MNIQKILDHYAICALWSSTDENDEPLDSFYTIDDIDPDTLEKMRQDIVDFVETNKELLLSSGQSDEQIGHDFWLTRNHHGAGFWDRGLGDIGEKLTKACHVYGDVYLYVSDSGKVCQ
jgi:hypothetical protein